VCTVPAPRTSLSGLSTRNGEKYGRTGIPCLPDVFLGGEGGLGGAVLLCGRKPAPALSTGVGCQTAKMVRMLRSFHHRCMRSMCRLSLWHTRHNHVKTSTLATGLGIQTIGTYIARRQLRWPGHVRRMSETRAAAKETFDILAPAKEAGG
jgi:hypothetical protein